MTENHDKRVGTPLEEIKQEVAIPGIPAHIARYDDFGLSLDPKDWAKSKCTLCWGRGMIPNVSYEDKNGNKFSGPRGCDCASKAYMKIRVMLEDAVLNIWSNENLSDDKKIEAAFAVIESAHKQVKNSGHVNRVALAKSANEVINRKIVIPRK